MQGVRRRPSLLPPPDPPSCRRVASPASRLRPGRLGREGRRRARGLVPASGPSCSFLSGSEGLGRGGGGAAPCAQSQEAL